jgi:prepilin-type processing-associated H-X9-DG protein
VAIVGEFVSDLPPIRPTVQQSGPDQNSDPYMTGPSDPSAALQPHSKHLNGNPAAGNYLFLDGHVEWLEKVKASMSPTDPLVLEMFPPVPPTPSGAPTPYIPCP